MPGKNISGKKTKMNLAREKKRVLSSNVRSPRRKLEEKMEEERIGKKKWRSLKIRLGFICYCMNPSASRASPPAPAASRASPPAPAASANIDVYEIFPNSQVVQDFGAEVPANARVGARAAFEEVNRAAAALEAERQYLASAAREGGAEEEVRMRNSVISLLKEGDESSRGERWRWCCVCMGRPRGAAFIPCGHTFCRLCAQELWVTRGTCPLCNRAVCEILDIF